jgi:hypothetical protein
MDMYLWQLQKPNGALAYDSEVPMLPMIRPLVLEQRWSVPLSAIDATIMIDYVPAKGKSRACMTIESIRGVMAVVAA